MHNSQPRVAIFCRSWATRGKLGLAGVSSEVSDSAFQMIPTMSSRQVDARYALDAFSKGIEEVLIAACPLGDCHYVSENHKTDRRVKSLKRTLAQLWY